MTREEAIAYGKEQLEIFGGLHKEFIQMAIEALERKKGKWNETSESIGWEEVGCAECSVCGETFVLGDYTMDDIKLGFNYCPNCGSDMRGEDDELKVMGL